MEQCPSYTMPISSPVSILIVDSEISAATGRKNMLLRACLQACKQTPQVIRYQRMRDTVWHSRWSLYVRLLGSWVTSENYQWQRSTCVTGILQLDILPPHSLLHILQEPHSFPEFPLPPHQKQPGCTLLCESFLFLKSVRRDPHTPLGCKVPSECSAMLLSFNDINNSSDKFLIPLKKKMFLSVPWNPKPVCDFSVPNHLLVPRCQNVF